MALVTELDEVGRVQPAGAFVHTDGMIFHRVRAKQILKSHPEARTLIGRNPWTSSSSLPPPRCSSPSPLPCAMAPGGWS